MPAEPNTALDDAWKLLFNEEPAPHGSALKKIKADEIRRVFLRAARRCHPDLARAMDADEQDLTEQFQKLQAAYTTILAHLEQTVVTGPAPATPRRPKGPWVGRAGGAGPMPPDPAQWGPAGVSMSGAHWIGPVPEKQLRIGRFLYYTGRISREALMEALEWQRAQRPDFGSTAKGLGLLGDLDLGTILDARRMDERIGRTAVRLGLLSPQMRDWVVSHQRKAQRPLGAYFVERGMLTESELAAALDEQRRHNDRAA